MRDVGEYYAVDRNRSWEMADWREDNMARSARTMVDSDEIARHLSDRDWRALVRYNRHDLVLYQLAQAIAGVDVLFDTKTK